MGRGEPLNYQFARREQGGVELQIREGQHIHGLVELVGEKIQN